MKFLSIKLFLSLVLVYGFFNQSIIFAQSVELTWSPSDETNLSHYNIYRSTFDLSDFILLGWAGEKDSTFLDSAVKCDIPYFYAATVVLQDGSESDLSNIVEVVISDDDQSVVGFTLTQNFPNPFNPATNIYFTLARPQWIKIKVVDICGREISVLANGFLNAGQHKIVFDGCNLSAGVYLINFETESAIKTLKTILLK